MAHDDRPILSIGKMESQISKAFKQFRQKIG